MDQQLGSAAMSLPVGEYIPCSILGYVRTGSFFFCFSVHCDVLSYVMFGRGPYDLLTTDREAFQLCPCSYMCVP